MINCRRAKLKSLRKSKAYDTYWKFAFERQEILHKRLSGEAHPWTNDPILSVYKFTNCYRVLDRVSQYLVKNVIGAHSYKGKDLFIRIMLFKFFNSIETWEYIENEVGTIDSTNFHIHKISKLLTKRMKYGKTIFSSAYIMPSRSEGLSSKIKHENLLALLSMMLKQEVPQRISELGSLKECYELIKTFPLMGSFLSYQLVIDLNYSDLIDHNESEFVVAGPGAIDGISKCFLNAKDFHHEDIIKSVTEIQLEEFNRLSLDFKFLKGRKLQLIDCQNLFCEVSKYTRISHPNIMGISKRHRIKRKYQPNSGLNDITLPHKWNLTNSLDRDVKIESGKRELIYA